MVLNLVLIGVAVALDPLPLMAFMIVLPSERGVRKGAAFVFGWLVSLAVVVTVTVLATGNNPPKPATAPLTGDPVQDVARFCCFALRRPAGPSTIMTLA
jgi:Sap, sulfolipid-1-addressing protein